MGIIYFDLDVIIAVTDSLVYNGLFAAIAVSLWYPVRYNNPEGKISLRALVTYLFLALIILPAWLYLGYFILKTFFPGNDEYFRFLNDTFFVRVILGMLYFMASVLFYHLLVYYNALEENADDAKTPECCGQPMQTVEALEACRMSTTAEHSRFDDLGEPCDDGRAGS